MWSAASGKISAVSPPEPTSTPSAVAWMVMVLSGSAPTRRMALISASSFCISSEIRRTRAREVSGEAAFDSERVYAYGFSLGSGVLGDGVINSMTVGDTTYTFTEHTVLASKDDCKKGGWETSTMPVFKNQGDCVSFFAAGK